MTRHEGERQDIWTVVLIEVTAALSCIVLGLGGFVINSLPHLSAKRPSKAATKTTGMHNGK
jgi:hypothetical protein